MSTRKRKSTTVTDAKHQAKSKGTIFKESGEWHQDRFGNWQKARGHQPPKPFHFQTTANIISLPRDTSTKDSWNRFRSMTPTQESSSNSTEQDTGKSDSGNNSAHHGGLIRRTLQRIFTTVWNKSFCLQYSLSKVFWTLLLLVSMGLVLVFWVL